MAKEQAVVELKQNGITETMPDWLGKGNQGSEGVTTNDMVLPRIDVLQALSPQLKKTDPAFIEGAEQGSLFNTVTGELYGATITVVPVFFKKEWVIWKLRNAGGGFIGAFPNESEANNKLGTMENSSQYEVVESHQHFVIILGDKGNSEAVLSMTKSKLKASRQLNTLIQLAGVDRFAKAYTINTSEVNGDKGDYWSYQAKPAGYVDKEIYARGKDLYELIKSGVADVDRNAGHGEETTVATEL
jgi:hypothetical protein